MLWVEVSVEKKVWHPQSPACWYVYDFIVRVITKQDESQVQWCLSFSAAHVKTHQFVQQRTTVLTRTPHLCLPYFHVSVKIETLQEYCNWVKLITGWNYQLWVLVCLVSASQSAQWASLLSESNDLNLSFEREWERNWKTRNSSSWVQSCQSKRWDKNLHVYTELTVRCRSLYTGGLLISWDTETDCPILWLNNQECGLPPKKIM